MSNKNTIIKSVSVLSVLMLLLKLFGFVKQSVVAYYFGANRYLDIYFIAYGFVTGISDALIQSVSISIIAVYTKIIVKEGKEAANKLISAVFEMLVPMVGVLILLFCIFAYPLAKILAPTYDTADTVQLSQYIYMVMPFMIFSMITLVCTAILDSNKKFVLPRLQSFIYSFIVIIFCVLSARKLGILTLLYAQYVAYGFFCILLAFSIRKYFLFEWVKISEILKMKSVKDIIKSAIPLALGNGALQINEIVDKSITSGIEGGATSALAYCHVLEQFVTAVLITNICAVFYSHFSEYIAKGEICQVENILSHAINVLICVLIGVGVISSFFSVEIVKLVYYRGNFSLNAVSLTSIALIAYSIGFPFVGVKEIVVRGLYAFEDTFHPMIISITTTLLNVGLSIVLAGYLGIFGVAIATTISIAVSMGLNFVALKKKLTDYNIYKHTPVLIKAIIAGAFMAIFIVAIKKIYNGSTILLLLVGGFISGIAYLITLFVLKVDEMNMLKELIKNKFNY